MTREPNGDVRFWETTKGHFYTLPGRWTGLYLDGAGGDALRTKEVSSAPQLRHKKSASGSALSLDAGGDSAEDRRKRRAALALALDKAEREAKRKAQVRAPPNHAPCFVGLPPVGAAQARSKRMPHADAMHRSWRKHRSRS